VAETLCANELICEFTLAKSREEFEVALRRAEYDLIISDFTLPSYDGLTALSLARDVRPEVPFVFFSGSIGEDIAVDSPSMARWIMSSNNGRAGSFPPSAAP
jgi:CheY-like chemotaxis protein